MEIIIKPTNRLKKELEKIKTIVPIKNIQKIIEHTIFTYLDSMNEIELLKEKIHRLENKTRHEITELEIENEALKEKYLKLKTAIINKTKAEQIIDKLIKDHK